MEKKTTDEIVYEHHSKDYMGDNSFCNVEWVSVEDIKKWINKKEEICIDCEDMALRELSEELSQSSENKED